MSSKIPVEKIEEATRAYDNKTKQYVYLIDRIVLENTPSLYWLCEDEDDNFIICAEHFLEDYHIM